MAVGHPWKHMKQTESDAGLLTLTQWFIILDSNQLKWLRKKRSRFSMLCYFCIQNEKLCASIICLFPPNVLEYSGSYYKHKALNISVNKGNKPPYAATVVHVYRPSRVKAEPVCGNLWRAYERGDYYFLLYMFIFCYWL